MALVLPDFEHGLVANDVLDVLFDDARTKAIVLVCYHGCALYGLLTALWKVMNLISAFHAVLRRLLDSRVAAAACSAAAADSNGDEQLDQAPLPFEFEDEPPELGQHDEIFLSPHYRAGATRYHVTRDCQYVGRSYLTLKLCSRCRALGAR